ncbi:hypothetical protein [Streptomyces sp. NPDC048225]|uniref:hypothetical protein n=1 Tax=Streptomyces sp. NPDC048225 TaxID=3365518 RepID=UPI0037205539
MKKLKATAALCGAIAAVSIGAPAFADDDAPASPSAAALVESFGGVGRVDGTLLSSSPSAFTALGGLGGVAPAQGTDAEKGAELGKYAFLNDVVDSGEGPVARPDNDPGREKAEKEARENANNPAIGSADANLAAWFKKRDGKTAKDLTDSQYLGLNPIMPGY